MGLIINDGISTDLGATENAYINIQEYHINKKGILTLVIRLYTSKTSRINNNRKIARHRNVPHKVYIILDEVDNDLTDTTIYTFGYDKLKEYLDEYFDDISDDFDVLETDEIV
jgi:hypothetical protein